MAKLQLIFLQAKHYIVEKFLNNYLTDSFYNQLNGLYCENTLYYIPINDTSFELSVFWPFDTESRINELMFSDSISLSFKKMLTSVTCFCSNIS